MGILEACLAKVDYKECSENDTQIFEQHGHLGSENREEAICYEELLCESTVEKPFTVAILNPKDAHYAQQWDMLAMIVHFLCIIP